MTSQKVFISGGKGFIGTRLTGALIENGHIVTLFDKIDGDFVRDPAQINNAFHHFKPDVVIHLAAPARPVASFDCVMEDLEANIIGTVNLLTACKRHNVTKFIFPSSAATNNGDPLSPYGISKLAGEKYVKVLGERFGLDAIVFRINSIWGDGGAGVVALYEKAKAEGRTVELFGHATRDFVHINDVIDLFVKAVEADPVAGFRLFDVGVDQVDMRDLANLIGVKHEQKPSREGEIDFPFSFDNSTELMENFGWRQTIKLGEYYETKTA